jgi:hypothetical protein
MIKKMMKSFALLAIQVFEKPKQGEQGQVSAHVGKPLINVCSWVTVLSL